MHLKTRVILGMASVAAAVGAALVPTSSAFAAPAMTVTWPGGDQGFGVQDGMTATAAGTGFPASTTVYVSECSTNVGNAADCDTDPSDGGLGVGQTDASGAFSVPVVARTETLGSAACGAGSTCYLAATTNPTAPDATNSFVGSLVFDRLQVTPRTGLKNGQAVNISGGGFNANGTVYVSECTSADPAKATQACDFNSIKTISTDANGAFATTTYPVHTGTVGSDGSKCNAGGGCIIAATDNVLNPANGHIGGAQLVFAPAPVLKALSVTAHSSKKHVAKGKHFAIKGKATSSGVGVKGLSVVLDKIKGGVPAKVASGKTGTGGAYAFTGLHQKKTTKYIVVITKQKGYKAAVSKTVKVSTP